MVSAASFAASPSRSGVRRAIVAGPVGLGLARVGVVLADVRGHGAEYSDARRPSAGLPGAGRPWLRGSVAAARLPPSRRAAVDQLDRVAVAERPIERLGQGEPMAPRGQAVQDRGVEARLDPDRVGRCVVLGRLHEPARQPPTAVATSAPPSTRAETTWAWICGWASPPIEPHTTHGRPSRKSIPGISVWSVRRAGASDVRHGPRRG